MRVPLLLVEDDKLMAQFIIQTVYEFNPSIDIHHSVNGEDALAELRERYFPLILLDLQMPLMGGLEVLQIAKGEENYYSPFIVISSSRLDTDIERAYMLGAAAYLCKIPIPNFLDALTQGLGFYTNYSLSPMPHYDSPSNRR